MSLTDWRWLILAIALVFATEGLNSAIEQLCDHLHPARHPAIGTVKDVAAGAVLVCAIAAALIARPAMKIVMIAPTPGAAMLMPTRPAARRAILSPIDSVVSPAALPNT